MIQKAIDMDALVVLDALLDQIIARRESDYSQTMMALPPGLYRGIEGSSLMGHVTVASHFAIAQWLKVQLRHSPIVKEES